MVDMGDVCHQTPQENEGDILMTGLKSSAMMGWMRKGKQHIHMLPFHPNTNLLKTGFKDANQRCAT
eukprot:8937208-Prorocentrum_lima.AAC.1